MFHKGGHTLQRAVVRRTYQHKMLQSLKNVIIHFGLVLYHYWITYVLVALAVAAGFYLHLRWRATPKHFNLHFYLLFSTYLDSLLVIILTITTAILG